MADMVYVHDIYTQILGECAIRNNRITTDCKYKDTHGKTGGTSTLMKLMHQHTVGRILTALGAEVSTSGENH